MKNMFKMYTQAGNTYSSDLSDMLSLSFFVELQQLPIVFQPTDTQEIRAIFSIPFILTNYFAFVCS